MEDHLWPKQVMETWGKDATYIIKCLQEGLTAYDPGGLKPLKLEAIDSTLYLVNQSGRGNSARWTISNNLCFFERSDFEAFSKKHGLPSVINNSSQKGLTEETKATEEVVKGDNYFVCTGDHWDISFQAVARRIDDCKGLWYIAHLLNNPDHEMSALQLSEAVNKPIANGNITDETRMMYAEMTNEQLEEEGLRTDGIGAKEKLPEYLKAEAQEIFEALEDPDPLIQNEGKERNEALLKALRQNHPELLEPFVDSLTGGVVRKRGSKLPSNTSNKENARTNIQRRIADAYSRLGKNGHDALVSHLIKHIRTGGKDNRYTSGPENFEWEIIMP